MKRILLVVAMCLLSFSLANCNPAQPKEANSGGFPTPSVTQDPKLGSVKAIILYEDNGSYKPFKSMNFYITPILSDATGQYRVTGLDRTTAPSATTDEQGRLIFSNIKPGDYAFIIDNVTQGWLLPETTGKGAMTVKVTAGQTIDLGTLKFQSVPVTPIP